MAAKDKLGGSPRGKGSPLAEYIETKTDKRCGTCEYLVEDGLCKQKVVLKDPKMKTDRASGLKVVNPKTGCCRFWEE